MELTLADIDPVLADRLQETTRFRKVSEAVSARSREQQAARALHVRLPRWWIPAGYGLLSVVATLLLVWTRSPAAWGITVWFGSTLFGAITVLRIRRAARSVSPAVAPAAGITLYHWEWFLHNMTLSSAQREYAGAVTALWQAAESGALSEGEAREILGDLNALAAAGRSLEAREKRLIEEQRAHDSGALAAERDRLVTRRDAATDEQAREAFAQGVELLDGRLARAAELVRLRERVEAERAVCAQAFASLQASLLSLAAGAGADSDALQTAEEARATAARLCGRVQAVEEVAALRVGAGNR